MYSYFHNQFLSHLNLCKKLTVCKYESILNKKQFTMSKTSKLREMLARWFAIFYIILLVSSYGFDRIRNGYDFIKILTIFGYLAYRIAPLNASFTCYSSDVHFELINYLNKVFKFEETLQLQSDKGNSLFNRTYRYLKRIKLCSVSIYFRAENLDNHSR